MFWNYIDSVVGSSLFRSNTVWKVVLSDHLVFSVIPFLVSVQDGSLKKDTAMAVCRSMSNME